MATETRMFWKSRKGRAGNRFIGLLDALDWMTDKTAEQVKQRIYSNLKNGAIILMHVGDDITGNILDEVFTYIENQGYKIVSLSEGIK